MKHKHAELIKAWADGAEIEVKKPDGWEIRFSPKWHPDNEYRIKPEPKPDVVRYYKVSAYHGLDKAAGEVYADLKVIWDGETGELKSAEVLK